MKLFITNKKEFDSSFENEILCRNIHIDAFNELKKTVDSENKIPITLTPSYKEDGCCIFSFINKRENTYFYEFQSTAS